MSNTEKSVKVSEESEIQISLKTLGLIVFGLVTSAWYVFQTQEKIHSLETRLQILQQSFENYKQQPGRSQSSIELLKKDIEYLKEHKH